MRKIKIIVFVVLGIGLVAGLAFFIIGRLKPQLAGLLVETTPTSTVFINGVQVGRSPYKETRRAEEVVVKLVPDSFDKPLAPYETKVSLVSRVETVIKWQFGESEEASEGEIVSFEKVGREETSLSVVTIPDSAQVSIDGAVRSFAPYKTSAIGAGEHTLSISANGFNERSIRLKTYSGYKLTAVVKLSISEDSSIGVGEGVESIEEELEEEKVVEVEIGETGVGFLRVRAKPSTLAEEVARVSPGERYVFVEIDEDTGWFLIEYEEGEEGLPAQTGWISNQYAEIVEVEEEEEEAGTDENSPTATPSATLVPTQ